MKLSGDTSVGSISTTSTAESFARVPHPPPQPRNTSFPEKPTSLIDVVRAARQAHNSESEQAAGNAESEFLPHHVPKVPMLDLSNAMAMKTLDENENFMTENRMDKGSTKAKFQAQASIAGLWERSEAATAASTLIQGKKLPNQHKEHIFYLPRPKGGDRKKTPEEIEREARRLEYLCSKTARVGTANGKQSGAAEKFAVAMSQVKSYTPRSAREMQMEAALLDPYRFNKRALDNLLFKVRQMEEIRKEESAAAREKAKLIKKVAREKTIQIRLNMLKLEGKLENVKTKLLQEGREDLIEAESRNNTRASRSLNTPGSNGMRSRQQSPVNQNRQNLNSHQGPKQLKIDLVDGINDMTCEAITTQSNNDVITAEGSSTMPSHSRGNENENENERRSPSSESRSRSPSPLHSSALHSSASAFAVTSTIPTNTHSALATYTQATTTDTDMTEMWKTFRGWNDVNLDDPLNLEERLQYAARRREYLDLVRAERINSFLSSQEEEDRRFREYMIARRKSNVMTLKAEVKKRWLIIVKMEHRLHIMYRIVEDMRARKRLAGKYWKAALMVQKAYDRWRTYQGRKKKRVKENAVDAMRNSMNQNIEKRELYKKRLQSASIIIFFLRLLSKSFKNMVRGFIRKTIFIQRVIRMHLRSNAARLRVMEMIFNRFEKCLQAHIGVIMQDMGLDIKGNNAAEINFIKKRCCKPDTLRIINETHNAQFHAYFRKRLDIVKDHEKYFGATGKNRYIISPEAKRHALQRLIFMKRKAFHKSSLSARLIKVEIPPITLEEVRGFIAGERGDPLKAKFDEIEAKQEEAYALYRAKMEKVANKIKDDDTSQQPLFSNMISSLTAVEMVELYFEMIDQTELKKAMRKMKKGIGKSLGTIPNSLAPSARHSHNMADVEADRDDGESYDTDIEEEEDEFGEAEGVEVGGGGGVIGLGGGVAGGRLSRSSSARSIGEERFSLGDIAANLPNTAAAGTAAVASGAGAGGGATRAATPPRSRMPSSKSFRQGAQQR